MPQKGELMAAVPLSRRPPLWEFLVHVLVGTGIFVVIAIPAVGLNLLVTYLSSLNVTYVIIIGLEIAEYALFVLDVGLYLLLLVRTGWRIIQIL